MPGSFYLVLPQGNERFSGEMSFTYFGCQSSNVGTVSGTKTGGALSGTWSGTVDNLAQSGDYSGTYDPTQLRYSGTYTNHGGKQHRDLRPCVEYDIAAFGTWEMSPVGARKPADFAISLANGKVSWAALSGVAWWLASVYDEDKALSGGAAGAAVIQQTFLPAAVHELPLVALGLAPGRRYILALSGFDAAYKSAAYTSLRYTAP